MKSIALIVVLAGCRQLAGLDDPLPNPGDASTDGAADAIDADASNCYGTGLLRICLSEPASGDVTLGATLSTSGAGSGCATNVVSGGTGLCVVAAAKLTLDVGATTRASGAAPLVLIAHDMLVIGGTLDAASHRSGGGGSGPAANFSGCNDAGMPPTGGGGAGGSFGGIGGSGGAPGPTAAGAALPDPTTLHGGCAGHDGGGPNAGRFGAGGGAVYLISKGTITIVDTGAINASGAGANTGEDGNSSGGGGGGSGGMIGLDAPSVVVSGRVFANGGGGGEGNDGSKGGAGNDPIDGAAGIGGNSAGGNGGPGGDGGAGAAKDGEMGAAGTAGSLGGGGGGGSVGVIKVFGTRSGGGMLSPSPS